MSVAPLRGALIGCGFVSQYHLAAWQQVSGARLVGLCDLDAGRLERASELVPGARTYREASALFAGGPLDFVEICTRPESHLELVALAARHKVHVLCQKPAATTAADLRAMIDACETAGVRLMIHENWRFRPWYRALRAEIDSGTIGRPIRLRLSHRDTRALRSDGFVDQPYFHAMPRLILLEMGCHLIDTARYLLGEVATVSATLGRFGAGHLGEDLATISLQFDSGALGLLDLTWCAAPDLARPEWALNESVVEGTEGMLRLRRDGTLERVGLIGAIEPRPVPLPPDDQVYLDGYIATQAHFIEGLRRGIEHETSGSDTLKTMEVVWSAYRSAEDGRRVILTGS
jgi:predicted dehydrogenase